MTSVRVPFRRSRAAAAARRRRRQGSEHVDETSCRHVVSTARRRRRGGIVWLAALFLPLVAGAQQSGAQEAPPAAAPPAAIAPEPHAAAAPGASAPGASSDLPSAGKPGGSTPAGGPLREAGEIFVHAGTAYEEGDYARAIKLYTDLLERGFRNGHLFYDLGNAYLRNGELGRAIAAYRRGRVLLPRDHDLEANLAFARKSIKDAITPPEPAPLLSTLFFWHYGLSLKELALSVLTLNFLFWVVWVLRLFRRDSEVLRWIFMSLLVLLLATGGSLLVRRALPRPVAVIVPQEIEAHTAPNPDSVVRFKLHAGTEVQVAGSREGWLRIALPDGQQGWIEEDWAEVVRG